MTDDTTFDKPSYLCDEQAWVRRLDYALHAETPATFRKRLAHWLPFFPDAAKAVELLNESNYAEFRRCFQMERDGQFAGEEFVSKFGAILLPTNAMKATAIAEQFQVPWGAAVIRISQVVEPNDLRKEKSP